jgi:hypothetical protein
MTPYRKVKEDKLSKKEIRSMKIWGANEVIERFFIEGILIGGVTLLHMMSNGEKEKDRKRNIRSMKAWGASPRGDTLFH